MAKEQQQTSDSSAKKGYTAPKGRPTRARSDDGTRRRAFGPVAQWLTLAIGVIVVVIVVIMLTNGGDFNPLHDDDVQFNPASAPAPGASPIAVPAA